jgi:hypothetical protein
MFSIDSSSVVPICSFNFVTPKLANDCRNDLIPFAELEKSPEHLHTYRLTPLSLWNAASCGFSTQDAIEVLKKFSRYDVPQVVCAWIEQVGLRFGKLILIPEVIPVNSDENSEKG